MKKMTHKEFKAALESVGIFSANDYESIINTFIYAYRAQANEYERYGCYNGAKWLREQAEGLYNILDSRGYYDDIKEEVEG